MTEHPFKSLPTRIAVAAVGIPLILWLTYEGGYHFFSLVTLISTLSLYEFYVLQERRGSYPLKTLGLVAGVLVVGAFVYPRFHLQLFRFLDERGVRLAMFSPLQFLLVVLVLFLLVILLVELFRSKGSPSHNLGATILGVMIIPLFFGCLIGLREVFLYGFPVHKFLDAFPIGVEQRIVMDRWGAFTVISLFATIWICDTAAYFVGSKFGKHKLFERVSPKKSWEGAIAGFIVAVAAMVVAQQLFLQYLAVVHAVVIGMIIGSFGQVGDLVQSRFKRDVGVKDSSAILPGHGGVYDRFDSVVFVSPIVYLYVDFIVLS